MSSTPSLQRHVFVALGLIAGATLMLEVTLIRLLSVALWYPFAYMSLSTAMLGFGGAAVAVSLSPRLRALPSEQTLKWAALAFCLTTVAGYPLWNNLPVDPMSLTQQPGQIVWVPLLLLIITLPFACAGLFIARTFAAWPSAAPWLYAADLAGATMGVMIYVLFLPLVGGPATLYIAGAAGAVTALLLHRGALLSRLGLAVLTAALAGASLEIERVQPLRITSNKLLGTELAQALPRASIWTLSSTIDVIEPNKNSNPLVIIDGGTAMTQVPRCQRGAPILPPRGLRALPYAIGSGNSTLVIGSGGGIEVHAALGARSKRVLALEIDSAINELVLTRLDGTLGGIFRRPQVELVTAEARSYLAAHDERFDAIVAFHTISNAASSTGAMSLAENYLLTVEAIELLLARLSDDGVLVMSRPEQQIGRLCATLAHAWPYPTDVRQHVAILAESQHIPNFITALVVSRQPLSQENMDALRQTAGGRVAYLPDGSGDSQDFFAAALAWGDPEGPALARRAAAKLPYRPATLIPATDNTPFFNLHQPWSELSIADVAAVLAGGVHSRLRLEDLPVAQVAIILLLIEATLLALLFVIPPALALRRHGLATRRATRVGLYFAALGFCFITVEVVLIQTLTRVVGRPGWSMVAVLATLLLTSGAGSAVLAGRCRMGPVRGCLGACGAALMAAFVVPGLVAWVAPATFAARVVAVVLIVTPLGLLMGVPFAAGLRQLTREDLVAWAWALNGLFSVGGSIAALILGSSIGFVGTAVCASLGYAAAAWAGRHLATR
jgi:spermidine synthase